MIYVERTVESNNTMETFLTSKVRTERWTPGGYVQGIFQVRENQSEKVSSAIFVAAEGSLSTGKSRQRKGLRREGMIDET